MYEKDSYQVDDPETNRFHSNSSVSERTSRDIYLRRIRDCRAGSIALYGYGFLRPIQWGIYIPKNRLNSAGAEKNGIKRNRNIRLGAPGVLAGKVYKYLLACASAVSG